jgi:cytochrome c biogenesis protein CcmG/thiol:disulfide interchange protein DsbE
LSCGNLFAVRLRVWSIVLFAASAGLAGCGSSQPRSDAPASTAQAAAFKGSPPALTSLHSQANKLLAGGLSAFRVRLDALHGYPVVVNKWASWCGPCQTEFPAFQQASVKFGRRVAFIGLDADDGNGSAAAFLHRYPVSYPSYTDPRSTIAQAYRASSYFPQTLFFTRQGHGGYVFDHAGPYGSAAALEKDIRQYVLR